MISKGSHLSDQYTIQKLVINTETHCPSLAQNVSLVTFNSSCPEKNTFSMFRFQTLAAMNWFGSPCSQHDPSILLTVQIMLLFTEKLLCPDDYTTQGIKEGVLYKQIAPPSGCWICYLLTRAASSILPPPRPLVPLSDYYRSIGRTAKDWVPY